MLSQEKCILCHKMLFLTKIKLKKQHIGIIIADENQHIKSLTVGGLRLSINESALFTRKKGT
ncbi:hypothetical protein N692_13775 [Lactiplantibacillus plantarum EGD-AQ4]|nr:hypothetical protein N692_13775 [Lactiplantibacillus plantarum EGD-AQ4]